MKEDAPNAWITASIVSAAPPAILAMLDINILTVMNVLTAIMRPTLILILLIAKSVAMMTARPATLMVTSACHACLKESLVIIVMNVRLAIMQKTPILLFAKHVPTPTARHAMLPSVRTALMDSRVMNVTNVLMVITNPALILLLLNAQSALSTIV